MVDKEPCPILLVQPTLDIAEAWSKDRLKPMVRDTPCLSNKIKIKSRDGDNTILHKTFVGGHITMAGANSPASLASRPIRLLACDEIDRYPQSAGEEGDPVNLAIKRTTRFWNRKTLLASTPTIKGASRIETAYKSSDMRVYEVPCPHCGHCHQLQFSNMIRPCDDSPAEDWEYCCPECGCIIEENQKMSMLRAGKWRATAPFKGIAGFYINELYSPWVTWKEMVANFLEAKKLPDTLKTFVNTSLAESWDEYQEGSGIESEKIHERAEKYDAEVPNGVYLLTAAVDVQDDRLEVEILGWGLDRETWSIKHQVIQGDPATSSVWNELSDILLDKYHHATGLQLPITCTLIDVGGHHAEDVYKYVRKAALEKRRIFGVRGHSVRGQPIFAKLSRNNSYKVKVFYCGTDTAKEMIYSYLALAKAGAGYMHHSAEYDAAYFEQLTAERKIIAREKGRSVVKWVTPSGKRNEALDLKVYNFCAYAVLKPNMQMVKERFEHEVKLLNDKINDKLNNKLNAKKSQPSNKTIKHNDLNSNSKNVINKKTTNKKRGGFVKNY